MARHGMGDRDDGFELFVRTSRASLVSAGTMLAAGDHHLAEDLVQVTLTKVYLAWPRVRPDEAAGYARKVLVHAFVDQTRRSWWRRERSSAELPERAGATGATGAHGAEIAAALRGLPPRMRAVLVLRYWFDLDVATTADELGCSAGTVRSQCARALAKMRLALGELTPVEGGGP